MDEVTYKTSRSDPGLFLAFSIAIVGLSLSGAIGVKNIPLNTKMYVPNTIRQEYSQSGIVARTFEYDGTTLSSEKVVAMDREKMNTNLERLNQISKLASNWNSNNAAPIPSQLIAKMKGLVFSLHYQPDIYPTACDSIQFEYEKTDGSYLEFELFEDKPLQVYSLDSNGIEKTELINFDAEAINKVVDSFYGREV